MYCYKLQYNSIIEKFSHLLKYSISGSFYSFKLNKNLIKLICRLKIFSFAQKYFCDNDFLIGKKKYKTKIIILIYHNKVYALIKPKS